MTFIVLVKDGQGQRLQVGAVKPAVKQARAILRCPKAAIHFFTLPKRDGSQGFDAYLFDSCAADVEYWLAAMKYSGTVLASGPIPQ